MSNKGKSSKKGEKKDDSPSISNKKAFHNYLVVKKFVAGMVLQGSEVKSCREGKVQLVDSYAAFERGELYLMKSHMSEFKQSGPHFNHPPVRKRKLLLKRIELRKIQSEIATSGMTLIPLKLFFMRGFVKVELGLCKGKSSYDKRATIKNKDEKRRVDKAIRRERG